MLSDEEIIALAKKLLEDEDYVVLDWKEADDIWGLAMDLRSWMSQNREAIPEPLRERLDEFLALIVKAIGDMEPHELDEV